MKTLRLSFTTEKELLTYATQFAQKIKPGAIIFLSGPLGVGKTTFTRSVLHSLGVIGKIKSPTYAIVESYEINHFIIFHFDFYRIQHPQELKQIGLADYFSATTICFIEWPEKGGDYLPTPDIVCRFAFAGAPLSETNRILEVDIINEQSYSNLNTLTR